MSAHAPKQNYIDAARAYQERLLKGENPYPTNICREFGIGSEFCKFLRTIGSNALSDEFILQKREELLKPRRRRQAEQSQSYPQADNVSAKDILMSIDITMKQILELLTK